MSTRFAFAPRLKTAKCPSPPTKAMSSPSRTSTVYFVSAPAYLSRISNSGVMKRGVE
ncbi:MAG: hypothetical protein AB1468_02505 [Candidatus Micrarchaeota archaeon]